MRSVLVLGLICCCWSASSALADEVWTCHIPPLGKSRPELKRFRLHEGHLLENGKLDFDYLDYTVLADNPTGIVAVAFWDGDPRLLDAQAKHTAVATLSVVIDKQTGKAAMGSVDPFGPSLPISYGNCRRA